MSPFKGKMDDKGKIDTVGSRPYKNYFNRTNFKALYRAVVSYPSEFTFVQSRFVTKQPTFIEMTATLSGISQAGRNDNNTSARSGLATSKCMKCLTSENKK